MKEQKERTKGRLNIIVVVVASIFLLQLALTSDCGRTGVAELIQHGGVKEEGEVSVAKGGEEGRGDVVVNDVEGALVMSSMWQRRSRIVRNEVLDCERESEKRESRVGDKD